MFSAKTIRMVIAGARLLHAIALGALAAQSLGWPSAARVTVRSWLLPALAADTAAIVAIPFWLVSTLGFLVASLAFWGRVGHGVAWRRLAVASAIVSRLISRCDLPVPCHVCRRPRVRAAR